MLLANFLYQRSVFLSDVLGKISKPREVITNYREDICLLTLLLLFKYANHKNKRLFVSTANEALAGTLMTIGDVNNIFPIENFSQTGIVEILQKQQSY